MAGTRQILFIQLGRALLDRLYRCEADDEVMQP